MLLQYFITCFLVVIVNAASLFDVTVETQALLHVTSNKFLSFALDTHLIQSNWKHIDLSNPKLIAAAKSLQPFYLRVGGTSEDFLYFNKTVSGCANERCISEYDDIVETRYDGKNFTMSVSDWDELNKFKQNFPDCDLYFGLNIFPRRGDSWDPTNALKLFRYTDKMNYDVNFELGNEPTDFKKYNVNLTPEQQANDFNFLRKILDSFSNLRNSKLAGPDLSRPHNKRILMYMMKFIKHAAPVLDAVTWHHYYTDSRTATIADFLNGNLLDVLKQNMKEINSVIYNVKRYAHIWLGETSSTFGGGTKGLSDRYVAGFMWLDKLGVSASMGLSAVIRQSLFHGNYALLNSDYSPRPDFWLSWVFKNLVSKYVLKVTVKPSTNDVRLYSHCLQYLGSSFPKNTIVLYGMNLLDEDVHILLPTLLYDQGAYVYWLTPGDDDGLQSRFTSLNGERLLLPEGKWFPSLKSKVYIPPGEPLSLKSKSFGFFALLSKSDNVCTKLKW